MPSLSHNGKILLMGGEGRLSYTPPAPPAPLLFTTLTNVSWDTFVVDGMSVSSAIEAPGTSGKAETEYLTFQQGDVIEGLYTLTLNSGGVPNIDLISESMGGYSVAQQTTSPLPGEHYFSFTIPSAAFGTSFGLALRSSTNDPGTDCSFEFTTIVKS